MIPMTTGMNAITKVTFKDNEAAKQNQYQGNEQIVAEEKKRFAAACNVADQRNNAAEQEPCSGDITDQQTCFTGWTISTIPSIIETAAGKQETVFHILKNCFHKDSPFHLNVVFVCFYSSFQSRKTMDKSEKNVRRNGIVKRKKERVKRCRTNRKSSRRSSPNCCPTPETMENKVTMKEVRDFLKTLHWMSRKLPLSANI